MTEYSMLLIAVYIGESRVLTIVSPYIEQSGIQQLAYSL